VNLLPAAYWADHGEDVALPLPLSLSRSSQPELLDDLTIASTPGARAELADNLRDIRRANRWFGGTGAVLRTVMPLVRDLTGQSDPVRILDVATGSADIPLAIAHQSERAGWPVELVATDIAPDVLAVARGAARPGRISVEAADALALPYADGAFDIVILSLALHHFEPDDGLRALQEMRRVGRHALIVNDFERSRSGLAGAWLFAHGLSRNRMTRHDAPLSVRRSYTLAEAHALARAAGWRESRVRRVLPFRYVLTGTP